MTAEALLRRFLDPFGLPAGPTTAPDERARDPEPARSVDDLVEEFARDLARSATAPAAGERVRFDLD